MVVTPSQASYFAGEVFSVNITITNIRRPETALPSRATSQSAMYGHKRGAHSVSYVPMARPPTSPGVRTALPAVPARPANGASSVSRRGLVGKPEVRRADGVSPLGEQARRRTTFTKSLSLSLGPRDFQSSGHDEWKGKSPMRTTRALETSIPCKYAVSSLFHKSQS